MGFTSRGTGGTAGGALYGEYPEPGIGYPCAAGPFLVDDFHGYFDSTNGLYGDMRWSTSTAGGITPTINKETTVAEHELGVLYAADNTSGGRITFHLGTSLNHNNVPPIGSIFNTKMRLAGGTSSLVVWAGYAVGVQAPYSSNSIDFVGVRYDPSVSSNWLGVCRNGTSETTTDLGQSGSAASTGYLIGGWERTADGYQFYTLDCSNPRRIERTDYDEITTNLPNQNCIPVFGLQINTASIRGFRIDWWSLGGRTVRGA